MFYKVNLGSVSFETNFNRELTDEEVEELKKYDSVQFYGIFNSSIDNLSKWDNLNEISFIGNFNKSLDNLPKSVKQISFSKSSFNKPLDNLPSGLLELGFIEHCAFNQPLNLLPNTLKVLSLDNNYLLPLNNLPISITFLKVSVKLKIDISILPNLKYLVIDDYDEDTSYNLDGKLPDSIEYVRVLSTLIKNIKLIPKKLKYIYCDNCYGTRKIDDTRSETVDYSQIVLSKYEIEDPFDLYESMCCGSECCEEDSDGEDSDGEDSDGEIKD